MRKWLPEISDHAKQDDGWSVGHVSESSLGITDNRDSENISAGDAVSQLTLYLSEPLIGDGAATEQQSLDIHQVYFLTLMYL